MSFRRKTYPEISERLLNRLLGGISGERHPYPPPGARAPHSHQLRAGPAASLTSVHGLAGNASRAFEPEVDFRLSDDGQRLQWLEGGQAPDAGSVVEINYLPRRREARANDLYAGSVVRTLLEAVSLETAGLYAEIDSVYRSAYLDTAEGRALDQVVALLGLQRVRAGRNSAMLEFRRARNARGLIHIPAGTRVATEDGAIEYETLDDLALQAEQPSGRIDARDLLASNDGVAAQALVLLVRPIAGIDSVANPAPSSRLDRDESDAELRARARNFLVGSERGTLGAIEAAVARQGLLADVDDTTPGLVQVVVHDDQLEPERRDRLERALDEARPAGVRLAIDYGSPPAAVDIELLLTTTDGLPENELRGIQNAVRAQVQEYFARLPADAAGSTARLIGPAMTVAGIEDLQIRSARVGGEDVLDPAAGRLNLAGLPTRLGELRLVDSALPTHVELDVLYPPQADLPDQAALTRALETAFAALNAAAGDAGRSLGWQQLVALLPLPGQTPLTLEAATAPGTALPDAAAIAPYGCHFVFARASGVSHLLTDQGAPPLVLGALERLSLRRLDVRPAPAVQP